jgi:hypothetical protein
MVRMSQGDLVIPFTFHLSRLTRNDLRMLADYFRIPPDCIRLAAGEHRDFFADLLSLLGGTAVV